MRNEHKNGVERKVDSDLYVQRMKVRNRESRQHRGSVMTQEAVLSDRYIDRRQN
jgi:peptide methionine sulfoxide reductase MsrB